jgi:hypothetical protein
LRWDHKPRTGYDGGEAGCTGAVYGSVRSCIRGDSDLSWSPCSVWKGSDWVAARCGTDSIGAAMYDGPGIQSLSSSHAIRSWHYLHSARRRRQQKRDWRVYVMGAAPALSMRQTDGQRVARRPQVGGGNTCLERNRSAACRHGRAHLARQRSPSKAPLRIEQQGTYCPSLTWGMGHGRWIHRLQ